MDRGGWGGQGRVGWTGEGGVDRGGWGGQGRVGWTGEGGVDRGGWGGQGKECRYGGEMAVGEDRVRMQGVEGERGGKGVCTKDSYITNRVERDSKGHGGLLVVRHARNWGGGVGMRVDE